jgi:hypothetical protein
MLILAVTVVVWLLCAAVVFAMFVMERDSRCACGMRKLDGGGRAVGNRVTHAAGCCYPKEESL